MFHQENYPRLRNSLLIISVSNGGITGGLDSIATANRFRRGSDIIAISYIPGLVYALGRVSPAHTAFLSGPKGSASKAQIENHSKIALQLAETERLRNAFVRLNTDQQLAKTLLNDRGLDFPGAYRNIGSISSS